MNREFEIVPSLAESDYNRQRLEPQPGDPLYIHLSDLRLGLGAALPPAGSRVLDYGCGGSPYRSLFAAECYHRADIAGPEDLDFVFGPDSRIAARDADYDCVLSTQVLEHVQHLEVYLAECLRVLRPGGRLILTTHGTYPDHGCPYDFWRWTADGLKIALERAGFADAAVTKLSTGPRALLFLNQQYNDQLLVNHHSRASWFLRLSRLAYTRLSRARLNRLADREYGASRVVPATTPGHEFYIALLVTAHKP